MVHSISYAARRLLGRWVNEYSRGGMHMHVHVHVQVSTFMETSNDV